MSVKQNKGTSCRALCTATSVTSDESSQSSTPDQFSNEDGRSHSLSGLRRGLEQLTLNTGGSAQQAAEIYFMKQEDEELRQK
ncbi:hypothetical protein ILUMI_03662 [Ignelater luminosus]|uniref:Uncharacterized protein n=1 Tax=Ignelater luminosus TaxID=2038154 RepID=A0A8K0DB50_IGNLU|nr:hypothetical protein ILUMI_03662 [Ignelater luminosus]